MIEYIKFWVAQSIIPFAVILLCFIIIAIVVFAIWVYEKIKYWYIKKFKNKDKE